MGGKAKAKNAVEHIVSIAKSIGKSSANSDSNCQFSQNLFLAETKIIFEIHHQTLGGSGQTKPAFFWPKGLGLCLVVLICTVFTQLVSKETNLTRSFKVSKIWIVFPFYEVENNSRGDTKGHSLCKQCLHNLQFMKKGSSSPNLSKLA